MLRYFTRQIELNQVNAHLGHRATSEALASQAYRGVIVATGLTPRDPKIEGQNHPKVLNYVDVLRARKPVGKTVAIIGAGGIGFAVAEILIDDGQSLTLNLDKWLAE